MHCELKRFLFVLLSSVCALQRVQKPTRITYAPLMMSRSHNWSLRHRQSTSTNRHGNEPMKKQPCVRCCMKTSDHAVKTCLMKVNGSELNYLFEIWKKSIAHVFINWKQVDFIIQSMNLILSEHETCVVSMTTTDGLVFTPHAYLMPVLSVCVCTFFYLERNSTYCCR